MKEVPTSLRTWFIIHFIVDMFTGIPLLIFPELVLPVLGWNTIDPIATRVVGAALMAIGIESWLGRNAGVEVFRAMLTLKVIWSSCAILGIGLGLLMGGPQASWLFMSVFAIFWVVWIRYRYLLTKGSS